jgi:hypothetical protein
MSNYNLTCLAIFGMLLIVTVTTASSLLLPATKIVSAITTTSGAVSQKSFRLGTEITEMETNALLNILLQTMLV